VYHKVRVFTLLLVTLGCVPGFAADSMIDQLYGLRKYELADAYYSAGLKFADLGQAERAAEFKAAATRIFPGYVPGQAPAAPVVAPAPEPSIPSAQAVLQDNLQGEKVARLQFQKLLMGYLTDTAATVSSVLAESLTVEGKPALADATTVAAFLQAHPAEAGSPDELFLLDSLELADGPNQSVILTVKANPDAPQSLAEDLPFWKPSQTYTFERVGDTWKLSKIGQ